METTSSIVKFATTAGPRIPAVVLISLLCVVAATGQNLLVNGSFEQDVVGPGITWHVQPSGWVVSPAGDAYLVRGNSGRFPPPIPFPDGGQVLGVMSDGSTISQGFSLASSSSLTLTFWDAHETTAGLNGLSSWVTIQNTADNTVVATSPTFQANSNTSEARRA